MEAKDSAGRLMEGGRSEQLEAQQLKYAKASQNGEVEEEVSASVL